jgi:hypothetical protein
VRHTARWLRRRQGAFCGVGVAWAPRRSADPPPAGNLDFIALDASARLVLADSSGMQKETVTLGVPCLTLRDDTERPITLTESTNWEAACRCDRR